MPISRNNNVDGVSPSISPIKLTLKCINNPDLIIDLISNNISVGTLKTQIEAKHGIISNLQRLIFNGSELADSSILSEIGIRDGANLHLVVRKIFPQAGSPDESHNIAVEFPAPIYASEQTPAATSFGSTPEGVSSDGIELPSALPTQPTNGTSNASVTITYHGRARLISIQRIRILRKNVMSLVGPASKLATGDYGN